MENCVEFAQSHDFNTQIVPYISNLEITEQGLMLEVLGHPAELREAVKSLLGVSFSREKDSDGLYQWITTVPLFNCQLWIIANESIDLTGTIVE